jgi:hypothetical protein
MKHLMVALLMLVMGFNSNAQVDSETYLMGEGDGMFAFTMSEPRDTFYQMYNSPPGIRNELRLLLLDIAYGYEVKDGVWHLHLTENNCDVVGEVFLEIGDSYVIFDFYVIETVYSDGLVTRRTTFEKPTRNLNKY